MNGDDIDDIVKTFENIDFNNKKPHFVISHSTKGLGVSFMENVAKWHHGVPKGEEYEQAVKDVEKRIEELKKSE